MILTEGITRGFLTVSIINLLATVASFLGYFGLYFFHASPLSTLFFFLIFYAPVGLLLTAGLFIFNIYQYVRRKGNQAGNKAFVLNSVSVTVLVLWYILILSGNVLTA